jgi:uncharacterized membrane protein YfcA
MGVMAGTGFGYWQAGEQPASHIVLEILGGALGGLTGSRLPDRFDPPLHPGHRSVAHGLVPVGCVGSYCWRQLSDWQEALRRLAAEQTRARSGRVTALEQAAHQLLEMLFRLLAGFIAGLLAGYASHLALDVLTPKGLPIIA